MLHSHDLVDYYQARAPEYDAIYAKPERQGDLRQLEHNLPPALANRKCLEIACGTGYWTQFLARSAGSLTGVDVTPATLAIAQRRCQNMRVGFVRGSAFALPFRADAFDGAFAGFWISHVGRSALPGFLAHLHGCLRAGARVVLLDNLYVPGNSTPIAHRDGEGNTFQDRTLADGSRTRVLKNFPTETELHALVQGSACAPEYRALEFYWVFQYEVQAR